MVLEPLQQVQKSYVHFSLFGSGLFNPQKANQAAASM